LVFRQITGVFQSRLNVLWFQIWIVVQNGILGLARGQQTQQARDGKAQAANARLACASVGINGNSI
jgi:hypothetical protein